MFLSLFAWIVDIWFKNCLDELILMMGKWGIGFSVNSVLERNPHNFEIYFIGYIFLG